MKRQKAEKRAAAERERQETLLWTTAPREGTQQKRQVWSPRGTGSSRARLVRGRVDTARWERQRMRARRAQASRANQGGPWSEPSRTKKVERAASKSCAHMAL
jgi:hypothetical protein